MIVKVIKKLNAVPELMGLERSEKFID